MVQDNLAPVILGGARFGRDAIPLLIVLGQRLFNVEGREAFVNICPVRASITCMYADALAKIFLDSGDEWIIGRQ